MTDGMKGVQRINDFRLRDAGCLLGRSRELVERILREQSDTPDRELVQLQHDLAAMEQRLQS